MWFGVIKVVDKPIIHVVILLEDVKDTGKLSKLLNLHSLGFHIHFGNDF
mgnify:CR=1 FL=1